MLAPGIPLDQLLEHTFATSSWVTSSRAWFGRLDPPTGAISVVNDSYGIPEGRTPGAVRSTSTQNKDGSLTYYTIRVSGHRVYDLAYAAIEYNTVDQVPTLTEEFDTGTGEWVAPS